MKKRLFFPMIISLVATLFSACYYDVESKLYPDTTCLFTQVSFTNDVLPIVRRSCFSCHNSDNAPQNGNIALETYDNIIPYVQNGMLMGSVHHENGFDPMPKDASKLSDCEILKLETWITDGAANN